MCALQWDQDNGADPGLESSARHAQQKSTPSNRASVLTLAWRRPILHLTCSTGSATEQGNLARRRSILHLTCSKDSAAKEVSGSCVAASQSTWVHIFLQSTGGAPEGGRPLTPSLTSPQALPPPSALEPPPPFNPCWCPYQRERGTRLDRGRPL